MAIVKKISDLTPKGSALGTTDLLIVGVDNGTDYDLKSVTGAQLLGTVVSQTITNGVTSKAPSEDVVFDNLALKVDKVAGNRLITTAEATILSNTSGTNTGDETVTTIKTKLGITTLSGSNTGDQDLSGKVDKVVGKGLSTEDYTTVEKSKLAGLSGTNTGDQTLQQVTDKGSTTTNSMTIQDATFKTVVSSGSMQTSTLGLSTYSTLDGDGKIQLLTNGVAIGTIKATNLASNITLELPNKTVGTYILATTSDFSGTNTGDETVTTIKTKLGITTLSGSNTGDQDLSTYQPYTTATTGSVISFIVPQVYNSVASPSSSNITDSLTSAKIGIVQKIYHNHTVAPTFPAGWVKMGTATYTTSTLNVIFAEWVSSTRVEYWITKPS